MYRRAGRFRGHLGDPEAGLELVDRALQLFGEDGDAAGRTEALLSRVHLLEALDRNDEGVAAVALAIEISARAGDPVTYRTRPGIQVVRRTGRRATGAGTRDHPRSGRCRARGARPSG